jgi:hypothetical protein
VDERVQEHGLNRGTKKETGLGLDQADRHATDHHDHSADATIHCIFIEHWSVRNDRRYLQKKGSGSTHGAYGLRLAAERVTTIVMIPSFAVCISSVPHAFSGENWEMTWRHEHGVEVSLCADCQIGLSFYRRAVSILHSCTGTWNQPTWSERTSASRADQGLAVHSMLGLGRPDHFRITARFQQLFLEIPRFLGRAPSK